MASHDGPDWSQRKYAHFELTFPTRHILQVTLSRVEKLNCINKSTSEQLQRVWEQFDRDEELRVGIITGRGRAFCTGADLQEWNEMNAAGIVNDMSAPGLAGLPRRRGKKPIIAAVNGLCMGGGFEMVANCDVVVAASTALFALPEAKRGIVPVAGCLPRLTRTLGLQRTTDLVLTGRSVSARKLYEWGLLSEVVDSAEECLSTAVGMAQAMSENSPDALIVGREGIRQSWDTGNVELAVSTLADGWYPRLMEGANFAEGVRAFVEKRAAVWVNSKL